MTVRLVETRRKQLGRRFFFTVVIPVCVGVIVWLLYQGGVFQPPSSQFGH
jgi:hypothetical protein